MFRPQAQADLFALYHFVTSASGFPRPEAYLAEIEMACLALADFPERSTRRSDIVFGLRTIAFEERVTVAFRVVGQVVEIVAIGYPSRDFEDEVR